MIKNLLFGLSLVALCGCASGSKMNPSIVRLGVGTTTAYALSKNPKAVKYVQAVAPVVCSAATGTNLAPAQIVALIQLSDAESLKTPEGVLIVNGALLLYTGIFQSYGEDTLKNSPELRGYLQATCDGMNDGLAGLTLDSTSKGLPPPPHPDWPLVQ